MPISEPSLEPTPTPPALSPLPLPVSLSPSPQRSPAIGAVLSGMVIVFIGLGWLAGLVPDYRYAIAGMVAVTLPTELMGPLISRVADRILGKQ